MFEFDLSKVAALASDHQGGVWTATDKRLMRLDRTGQVLLEVEPFSKPDKIVALVADPTDSSVWVASKKQISHLRSDGHPLHQLTLKGEIQDLALYADLTPPGLAFTAPRDGMTLDTNAPTIEVEYGDSGSGVDVETLRVQANDADVAASCRYGEAGASCTPITGLPEGVVTLTATIQDHAGNLAEAGEVRVTIDTAAPVITLSSPLDGTVTNQALQSFVGSLSEPATLTINGLAVQVDANLGFHHGPISLQQGLNSFALVATDAVGHSSHRTVQITLDTAPPAPIENTSIQVSDVSEGQVQVSGRVGSVEPGANVTITNTRTGQTVTVQAQSDGSFTLLLAAQSGDILSIVTSDGAGNASSPSTIEVGGALPPDPTTIAPPLDRTVATDIATATAFLYSGNHPIQTGVAEGTIEPRRVAVLRGRVRTHDGASLAGVTITILGHPEFGQTLTRVDGLLDIAVNGGGLLTVRYEKKGYLPVQRQVEAPWRDYAWLPDVVMLPYDEQVTPIDLTAVDISQVAEGSVVTDERGTRQATLLFAPGTQAIMIMPDGNSQRLNTLHVRATEYTVGPNGPTAMPGELPPTSAYTYAVELSVDEAVAAGATTVQFSQPMYVYVENFLDFPVGEIVPAGYYDRQRGLWVASENGQVIQIVQITDGIAEVDADGDGVPDDPAALTSLGITEAERQRLATLYQPGQSLWRVPVSHFTPWDFNWPARLPDGVTAPNQPLAVSPQRWVPESDQQCGSIIDCQNQTLGEVVAVNGTSLRLHYQSDRVPGPAARRTLEISLTGNGVGAITGVQLHIDVAGQRFQERFTPTPNLTYSFTWDGRDGYGREVQGEQPVTIIIGHDYNGCYERARQIDNSFAQPTSGGNRGGGWRCTLFTAWQRQRGTLLGGWDSRAQQLGGWTLNVHHAYNFGAHVINRGDGTRRSADSLGQVIIPVAGVGAASYVGDGGPATRAWLAYPAGLTVGPDGSLYIADSYNNRIRRVDPNGLITTVAGNGTGGSGGDGGPATQAQLYSPVDVALGIDGSLYIADSNNYRVRRVSPEGIITTVAGTGMTGSGGDGQPATQAALNHPYGITVGQDGSLYIAELFGHRVRRVGPDGLITTVAGMGTPGFSGDGGPAMAAHLANPWGLAIGPDGSLYIADASNYRIRRVSPDGLITTVAGNGTPGHGGDGGLATRAQLYRLNYLAVGPDSSLFIADSNYGLFDYTLGNYVRRVRPDGIITTVAGTTSWGDRGDGGPATQASIGSPEGMALGPDGSLYISDDYFHRVRRVAPPLPSASLNALSIPSGDGSEVYVFDGQGKHLRTLNALTGVLRYQFTYDSAGRLVQIVDGDGLITTIERDAAGNPTAIVAPFGQRTTLQLDDQGYLASLTNPAGEATRMLSTTGGLLTSLTNPKGHSSRFTYDALGRLLRDEDAAGGFKALARTENADAFAVSLTSALGRATTYQVEYPATGGILRVNTDPRGLQTVRDISSDGRQRITAPDGTITTMVEGPDPRFGMQAPLLQSLSVTTPAGLNATVTATRTVALANPLDLLSATQLTDTINVHGRSFTSIYDAASSTVTSQTPMGRRMVSTLDGRGRVVEQRVAGLEPLRFTYDGVGQLVAVTQGPRHTLFAYDVRGRLAAITDPLSRTVAFEYDAVGRITRQLLPEGREVLSSYDANGNVTSFTPPGRPSHAFTYTSVDLEESYLPPEAGMGPSLTHFTYNLDRQPVEMTRPDGSAITLGYDGAGRVNTLMFPSGPLAFHYDATTGNLVTITDPEGGTLSYGYDGSLLTRETWAGNIAGSIQYTYDNNFRLTSQSVNGDAPLNFQYDADSLLTQVGALAIGRDPQNGHITGSTLGNIVDARTHSSFGELSSYKAALSGSDIFVVHYTRDALGRIIRKTETIDGQTNAFSYTYDVAGRLTEVRRDDSPIGTYVYDSNGNRLSYASPDGNLAATYDVQDRLLQYGSTSYTYTANGELQHKTAGSQTTTYEYDALGNLRQIILPDSAQIEYVIDGRNRRVGKKVNGTLVQGFLYAGDLAPVAELNGSGQVTARFIYGTRGTVPDYMIKGGITYRLITDHLGSPRLVIDTATGHIVQRLAYDTFGQVTFDDNPGFQPFGFAGGLYDPDTKLTRFGARDYDAETGRWTAKDPIRFAGGDTNLYGYVLNDPVNWVDPTGLFLDSALDVGFIGYDLYRLVKDNIVGNCGNLGSNLAALGGDVAGALIPFVSGLGTAARGGGKLYHYTGANPAKIMESGLLPGASGKVFTTPNGTLSPLQAQLDLALPPNRGLPRHLLEIDMDTLTSMGINVPKGQSITRMFNLPGGGIEVVFTQIIPRNALKIIR
jgi:RHS repeat-associated protein